MPTQPLIASVARHPYAQRRRGTCRFVASAAPARQASPPGTGVQPGRRPPNPPRWWPAATPYRATASWCTVMLTCCLYSASTVPSTTSLCRPMVVRTEPTTNPGVVAPLLLGDLKSLSGDRARWRRRTVRDDWLSVARHLGARAAPSSLGRSTPADGRTTTAPLASYAHRWHLAPPRCGAPIAGSL